MLNWLLEVGAGVSFLLISSHLQLCLGSL